MRFFSGYWVGFKTHLFNQVLGAQFILLLLGYACYANSSGSVPLLGSAGTSSLGPLMTPAMLQQGHNFDPNVLKQMTPGCDESLMDFNAVLNNLAGSLAAQVGKVGGTFAIAGLCSGGGLSMESPCPMDIPLTQLSDWNNLTTKVDPITGIQSGDICSVLQNPSTLQGLKNAAKASLCAVMCREAKLKVVTQTLQCVQNLENTIASQTSGMLTQFQNLISSARQQVILYDQQGQSLKLSDEDILNYLNGDPDTKVPGLLAAQSQLQSLLVSLPANLSSLQGSIAKYQQMVQQHSQQVNIVKLSNTLDCVFNRPEFPPCDPTQTQTGGTSFVDYLVCQEKARASLGVTGQLIQNSVVAQKASFQANQLQSVLNQIQAASPTALDFPSPTATSIPTEFSNPGGFTSINDLSSYFSRLAAFNLPGLDVPSALMQMAQHCEAIADQKLQVMLSNSNSNYNQSTVALEVQEQNLLQQGSAQINDAAGTLSTAVQALTGTNAYGGIVLNQCNNSLANEASCISNELKTANDMLRGSGNGGQFQIHGLPGFPAPVISCLNVLNCVNALTQQKKLVETQEVQNDTQEKAYKQLLLNSVQSSIQSVASALSPLAQYERNQLTSVTNALTNLQIPVASFANLKADPIKADSDGIPIGPANIADLLKANSNPPFFNATQGIGTLTQNIASATADAESKLSQAASNYGLIKSLEDKCSRDASLGNQDSLNALNEKAAGLTGCTGSRLCSSSPTNTLSHQVQRVLDKMNQHPGSSAAAGVLGSNLYEACKPPASGSNSSSQGECHSVLSGLQGLYADTTLNAEGPILNRSSRRGSSVLSAH